MNYFKVFLFSSMLLVLGGCASKDCKPGAGKVLKGTDTALVGLYIDDKGYPQAIVKSVVVYPGQKIIFAGPDQFDILFKDNKSPIDAMEIRSSRGLVTIEVPIDIFERKQRESKSADAKDELRFNYGIRVKDKVTDPEVVVRRR